MDAMKEILSAAKRGDFEIQEDGRCFVFTNKEICEGYMLEKDQFKMALEVKSEYLPGSGNRYAVAIIRGEK